jgi:hypothetical protein
MITVAGAVLLNNQAGLVVSASIAETQTTGAYAILKYCWY